MDGIEGGCIVSHHLGLYIEMPDGERKPIPCEVHHLTVGGKHGQKRRGHRFTVGLNPWSHRGVPFGPYSARECKAMFGPSYAKEPRAFRELYPDELLLAWQDELLGVTELDVAA
jgi:hypothetical protein